MKEVGRVQMGYLRRILELNFVQAVTMLFQIAISICIRDLLSYDIILAPPTAYRDFRQSFV